MNKRKCRWQNRTLWNTTVYSFRCRTVAVHYSWKLGNLAHLLNTTVNTIYLSICLRWCLFLWTPSRGWPWQKSLHLHLSMHLTLTSSGPLTPAFSLSLSITLSSHLIGGHPLTFPASILLLYILFVNSLLSILSKCPNHLSVLHFTISTTLQLILSPVLDIPNFLYTFSLLSHPFCSHHIHLSNT